jgi:hypothetical protein
MSSQILARCRDCWMAYESFPLDVVLPDDQWAAICPEGGVLCAGCIISRIAKRIPDAIVVRAHVETVARS